MEPEQEAPSALPAVTDEWCRAITLTLMEESFDRLLLYDALARGVEPYFDDYTGGETQAVYDFERFPEAYFDSTSSGVGTFFWRDDSGSASPAEAAGKLTELMLESLKTLPPERRSFTLLDYSVKEQTPLDRNGLASIQAGYNLSLIEGMERDEAEAILREDMERICRLESCEVEQLALGEDMWVFDPELTFDFEGAANMYRREWIDDADPLMEDGLIREYQQGVPFTFTYILMKNGDIWRMQWLPEFYERYK